MIIIYGTTTSNGIDVSGDVLFDQIDPIVGTYIITILWF